MDYVSRWTSNIVTKLWSPKPPEDDDVYARRRRAKTDWEPFLISLQNICLWTSPWESAVVLVLLLATSALVGTVQPSNCLERGAFLYLICYVGHTFVFRLWPEIRVEKTEEELEELEREERVNAPFQVLHPAVLSGNELCQRWRRLQDLLARLVACVLAQRARSPGVFFVKTTLLLLVVAFVGQYQSISRLILLASLMVMTLPYFLVHVAEVSPINEIDAFLDWLENRLGGSSDQVDAFGAAAAQPVPAADSVPESLSARASDLAQSLAAGAEQCRQKIVDQLATKDDHTPKEADAKIAVINSKENPPSALSPLDDTPSLPFLPSSEPMPSPEELEIQGAQELDAKEDKSLDEFMPAVLKPKELSPFRVEEEEDNNASNNDHPDYDSLTPQTHKLAGDHLDDDDDDDDDSLLPRQLTPDTSLPHQDDPSTLLQSAMSEEEVAELRRRKGSTVSATSTSASDDDFEMITDEDLRKFGDVGQ